MGYDEQAAIDHIRARLSAESSQAYSDGEILNVIDMIWDFYEDSGLLEVNADANDDTELDIDALTAYVTKTVAKDRRSPIKPEDIPVIIAAEIDFEAAISDDF